MRALLLLPLLMVSLTGCLSDSDDSADDPVVDPFAQKPALEFRDAVDLASKAGILNGVAPVGALGTNCQDSLLDGDCGLGEPSIEVDGAGTIYVSGVCCLTVAPPVLVSRDGGETFQTLDTFPPVREQFGIEGDFAIDGVGRMYFADIEFAATFQMSVWDPDGTFVRHTKWPAPPLVDRDWVRAEGDGTVYYVYNTGATGTRVYVSQDAAATWTLDAVHVADYALGNTAIWPGHEICVFGGNTGGFRGLDCSASQGDTWMLEASSLPVGQDAYPVGSYDEAGNMILAEAADDAIAYTMRSADGSWSEATAIVSPPGHHRMPWTASGAEGAAAIAWYGTPDETIGMDTEWFLHVAASRDAREPATARWDWTIADPEPVLTGDLQRQLLDFLQIDMGPDGALHVAYSKLAPGETEEQLTYVRSEPSPLAMDEFFYGP